MEKEKGRDNERVGEREGSVENEQRERANVISPISYGAIGTRSFC